MAKDDYFVIVYKILAYLYMKLKNGEDAVLVTKEGNYITILKGGVNNARIKDKRK